MSDSTFRFALLSIAAGALFSLWIMWVVSQSPEEPKPAEVPTLIVECFPSEVRDESN
jgi:hypothetical protein